MNDALKYYLNLTVVKCLILVLSEAPEHMFHNIHHIFHEEFDYPEKIFSIWLERKLLAKQKWDKSYQGSL